MEENEEIEDGEQEQEFVFGIPVPDVTDGVQPLECLVLVKGINLEDGMPTMTTIGSDGITPWEAVGMMQMEIERIKFMTIYSSIPQNGEE